MTDFNKELEDNLKRTLGKVKKLMDDSQTEVNKAMKGMEDTKENAPYKSLFQEYINKINNGEIKSSDIDELKDKFNNLGSRG